MQLSTCVTATNLLFGLMFFVQNNSKTELLPSYFLSAPSSIIGLHVKQPWNLLGMVLCSYL